MIEEVNVCSDCFFLNWDSYQLLVEVYVCVYPLPTSSVLLLHTSPGVFLKQSWPKNLMHEREGQSWERQFTLNPLKSNKRRVCFQDRVSGEGLFLLQMLTIILISLSYLFETPTNFIYIFIRCRQGWHICVRRPPVHRRLHFYIAAFWKLAGEDGWVLNCGVRIFTAIQGTSARTAHGFFHVICKAREIS